MPKTGKLKFVIFFTSKAHGPGGFTIYDIRYARTVVHPGAVSGLGIADLAALNAFVLMDKGTEMV
jgi:hypothetical protein